MPQDILITPGSGEPQILFRGSGIRDTSINLNVVSSYQSASTSGTALLFEGAEGQLFAITDNLSSGTIFAVGDYTGLPIIDVDSSGIVSLSRYGSVVDVYNALQIKPSGFGASDMSPVRFYGTGVNFIGLRGPASIPTNTTFTLPSGDGTSGQVLQTNGSGTLSWGAGGGGGITGLTANYVPKAASATTLTNSQIFDDGTNVGINNASPAAKLDVYATTSNTALLRLYETNGGLAPDWRFIIGNGGNFQGYLKLGRGNFGNTYDLALSEAGHTVLGSNKALYLSGGSAGIVAIENGATALYTNSGNDLGLWGLNAVTFRINSAEQMRLNSTGFGIGTTSPDARIHVVAASNSAKASIIRGAASQTANLTEWQNSAGTVLTSVDSGGNIKFDSANIASSPSGILYLNISRTIANASNIRYKPDITSPGLIFTPSGTLTPPVTLNLLTDATNTVSGVTTLSFEGSAGQLFSITDQLASGVIFSVNDIGGLPLIEADASGLVHLGRYGEDVRVYKNLNIQNTYSIKENIIGNASGNVTINLASGNYVIANSTAATTWRVSGVPNNEAVGFILQLASGGLYTQTWPSGSRWPGGTAPTLTPSGVDVLTFITTDFGTTFRAVLSMQDSK